MDEFSLQRVKALLGKQFNEEKLKKVLDRIRAVCKVAYQLYTKSVKLDKTATEVKPFKSNPPDEFTNAA